MTKPVDRRLPVVIDGLTAPEAFGRCVFAGRVIAELKDEAPRTAIPVGADKEETPDAAR